MAIKLLIGGSPCTYWSIAQSPDKREVVAEGIGWELFKNYIIAKEKFKPDLFLYENNKSASQAIKDQIATELGVGVDPAVRFTYINSALVSAQNRQRFYVTNFGDIEQPEDRGILLKDVLEGCTDRDKARAVISSVGRTTTREYFEKSQNTMAFEPVNPLASGKARCVTAGYANKGSKHILESNYSDNPSKQTWDSVAEPVRVGDMPNAQGEISGSQSSRIYDINGKSVTQSAGGGGAGAKTGLYAIPVDEQIGFAIAVEWDENGEPTKARSGTDGKTYTVYKVENGLITIKGKQYEIDLADGYYIIRKLTVKECARLQTMPDDYCKAVSDSQAYKALGNGWTAEVIIHLLNHALKDVPRDEEIIVLSLSMTALRPGDIAWSRWALPMSPTTHTRLTPIRWRLLWIITPTSFNTAMLLQFVRMIGNRRRLVLNGSTACWEV